MARNALTMGCGKIERFENDMSWISLKSQMVRRLLGMKAWEEELTGPVGLAGVRAVVTKRSGNGQYHG